MCILCLLFQVMFEGIRGSSWQGDIAIDDVQISSGICVTGNGYLFFTQCLPCIP